MCMCLCVHVHVEYVYMETNVVECTDSGMHVKKKMRCFWACGGEALPRATGFRPNLSFLIPTWDVPNRQSRVRTRVVDFLPFEEREESWANFGPPWTQVECIGRAAHRRSRRASISSP